MPENNNYNNSERQGRKEVIASNSILAFLLNLIETSKDKLQKIKEQPFDIQIQETKELQGFETRILSGEQILDNPEYFNQYKQVLNMVSQELSIYETADPGIPERDLKKHLTGAEILLQLNEQKEVMGFGIYRENPITAEDNFSSFMFAFIVAEKYQSRGLGRSLILEVCKMNPNSEYITAHTQNPATIMAFYKALQDGLLSPNIDHGLDTISEGMVSITYQARTPRVVGLTKKQYPIVSKLAKSFGDQIDSRGIVEKCYFNTAPNQHGLYNQELDQSRLELGFSNLNSAKGILIVAKNPYYIKK